MDSSPELASRFPQLFGDFLRARISVEFQGNILECLFDDVSDVVDYDAAVVVIPHLVSNDRGVFTRFKVTPTDSLLEEASSVLTRNLDRLSGFPVIDEFDLLVELRRRAGPLVLPKPAQLVYCMQPVVLSNETVGLICILRSIGPAYDETDSLQFAATVGKFNIRLETERLACLQSIELELAEEEIKRLQALETLSTRISTTLDPKKVAETVSTGALDLIPRLDVGSVWVANEQGTRLDLLAEKGYPARHFEKKAFVDIGEDFAAAEVVRTGRPEFREDLSRDRNSEPGQAVARRVGLKAWACLPLIGKDRVLGSLFIGSYYPRGWDRRERSFLVAVASLVSQAMENSLLYQQAEAQRKWLQTIIDQMPEAVLIAEPPRARITMANRAFEEMMGIPVAIGFEMMKYPTIRGTYRPNGDSLPSSELPIVRSLVTGETYLGLEMLVRRPDGSESIILANSSALKDAQGTILGSVVVSQDITRAKEVERLKDEFLYAASHELKTPLTSIRGFTQSMLRRLERRAAHSHPDMLAEHNQNRKSMDIVIRQVDKLTSLVDDLLDVSRLQRDVFSITRSPVDLAALSRSVVDNLQTTSENHRLRLMIEEVCVDGERKEPSFGLFGDERRLEHVLTNLIHNAIKFSPRGGDVEIRLARKEGEVLVTVTDQGIGIPADQFGEIFELFSQASNVSVRHFGGLGLGLFLCHEIIERHGGRIWPERSDDSGSVFCFTVPVGTSAEA